MRAVIGVVIVCCFLCPASVVAQDEHPVAQQVKEKLKDPAKPFTMIIRVKIKPGTSAKLEAAFAAARKESRKEKGNSAYDLNRSTEDENVYIVYERWANLEALQAHLKAAHVVKFFQEAQDCFDGSELRVFVPVAE